MARYIDDGTLIIRSSNDQIMFDLHEIKMYYPSNFNPYDMQLYFISFDFSSLYTSIDNNSVIDSFMF